MATVTNGIDGTKACYVQPAPSTKDDVRRAREFYRYLHPDNLVHPSLRRRSSTFDVYHDHVPSLSSALAPFCQLTGLRCNAAKAMLNFMNRDAMYFLAEASLRRDTQAEEGYEFYQDKILLECSSVPIEGRICELTLRLDQPEDINRVPTFIIPDLTKSQFADMTIVKGPPYYRFYAGVPITTRDGVNIGSLAIMDTNVRPDGLTVTEEQFMGTTANQIMTYLETNRQAIEGRRSRQMAEGLEAFIAGKRTINEPGSSGLSPKTLKRRARAAYGITLDLDQETDQDYEQPLRHRDQFRLNNRSNSIVSLGSEKSSSLPTTDSDEEQRKEAEGDSRSHSKTFARAANLLRECLGDLGEDGSVHFVSLSGGLGSGGSKSHSVNGHTPNLPRVSSLSNTGGANTKEEPYRVPIRSSVIASSCSSAPELSDGEDTQTLGLDDDILRDLFKRYPGGRLWTLDNSAATSSDDDTRSRHHGQKTYNSTKSSRSARRREAEMIALRIAFPSAQQVMFTPVWDAAAGSFSYGCFVSSTLETLSFSPTSELPFLNSFCSTVIGECSRLDTMVADRQKSDFVGTISHEMRSPLHGVLASVEFLAETELTSFQRSLIETIDSCGRTLLDTINHVLDFSKVNSFQKHWQAANKKNLHGGRRSNFLGPENSARAATSGAPPLLQLFGVTNISTVLEEVVDGLVLGHTYNSGIDITDTSKEARGRAVGKSGNSTSGGASNPVDLILDVQQGDWNFMTQPGAVRRIIMNVTGNAIKYTTHGVIKVSLQQKDASADENSKIMVFTVTDTGKGISPEFLASKLFIPFAQENALAPGTGLGMSIVRSIVLMLGGTIDVKSKVGHGTTVEVALPMKRPLAGQVSSQTTPLSGGTASSSGNSAGDDSIVLLKNQAIGETVALYRQKQDSDDSLSHAVQHYVRDWYGLPYHENQMLENSSVIIVEEEDLEHLLTTAIGNLGKRPAVVVFCSVSSRNSPALIASLEDRLSSPVEFVAKPCGPNKLARSIRQALERRQTIKSRFPTVTNLGVIPEAITPGSSMTVSNNACDPSGHELQQLDLSTPRERGPIVQATENFAASQISHNAHMAVHDPSASLRTPGTQMSDHDAFPFPVQADEPTKQRRESSRSRSVSFETQTTSSHLNGTSQDDTETPTAPAGRSAALPSAAIKIDPHVLLVDDNKINLRLLETFLKNKRKYTKITKAEDGQQAVNAVMAAKDSFDIIFMDISMPVMNGFEATRVIRDHESKSGTTPGAMIIALTGLASGRDQSEGFASGCDIYMTKPVSFKEVGKLLNNWEGHQVLDMEQGLHDAMTQLNLRRELQMEIPVQAQSDQAG